MEKRTRKKKSSTARRERVVDETRQSTIEKGGKAKLRILEEYYNFDSMRDIPISEGTLKELVRNGIIWARTEPDAIKINQFLDNNGIYRSCWDTWRGKYDTIKNGHDQILTILGNKRELGLITRKFDSGSTERMMPLYDKDWKDIGEWRASLSTKNIESKGQVQFQVVEIPIIKVDDDPKK